MPEDMTSGEHEFCTEFSHSFLDIENVYIVGYQCSNTFLFWGVVLASFVLVVVQVKIGVRDGQASRMALATKKGSPERKRLLRKILMYTAISSALSIVHTVLVVGLNLYVLIALTTGNIYGVYTSYRRQEADHHCSTADICAWLAEAQTTPKDERFVKLREDLRLFLMMDVAHTPQPTLPATADGFEMDCAPRRRQAGQSEFQPYRDHAPARMQWKL